MKSNARNWAGAGMVVVALQGCAGLGGGLGKSEFSCSGMPDGVTCATPIEVYEHTHDLEDLNDLRVSGKETNAEDSAETGLPGEDSGTPGELVENPPEQKATPEVAKHLVVSRQSPMPILEPAKVMRIWIAPWVDANQDLHWPGFAFSEITPRRWQFGEGAIRGVQTTVPAHIVTTKKNDSKRGRRTAGENDSYYATDKSEQRQVRRRGPGDRLTEPDD